MLNISEKNNRKRSTNYKAESTGRTERESLFDSKDINTSYTFVVVWFREVWRSASFPSVFIASFVMGHNLLQDLRVILYCYLPGANM